MSQEDWDRRYRKQLRWKKIDDIGAAALLLAATLLFALVLWGLVYVDSQ